jgi:hypothetical protein
VVDASSFEENNIIPEKIRGRVHPPPSQDLSPSFDSHPFSTQRPFGYVDVLQEEDVNPSVGQRDVLNQLRDWDLW